MEPKQSRYNLGGHLGRQSHHTLTVIEQLTYLMFIRSLDEKELETEEWENMTGTKMDKIFPASAVGQSMRWSKFKNNDPRDIYDVISQRVFPASKI